MTSHVRAPSVSRVLGSALSLAWAAVLFRMWGGGFTGGDEAFTATAAYNFHGIWAAAKSMSEYHGRFYHLVIYPLAQVPYVVDSLAWTNAIRILSSGAAVVAFWFFVRELFGNRLALIAGFLLLALQDTVGDGYNPFHALPLWFNLGTCLLFCSLALHVRATARARSTALAYVMYFLSLLSYESVLLYALAFPFMFLWVAPLGGGPGLTAVRRAVPAFLRSNAGLLVAVIAYLGLYVAFRAIHPPQYEGAKGLTWGGLDAFLTTIGRFSANGIYLRGSLEQFRPLSGQASLFSLIAAAGVAVSFALPAVDTGRARRSPSLLPVLATALFIPLPNVLFGLTDRYRQWVKGDPYYLGSYFSSFAICLVFALALVWLLDALRRRSEAMSRAAILLVIVPAVSFMAYLNHWQSISYFKASRVDARKWPAMSALAADLGAGKLGGVTHLCTRTLITAPDPYDYWSNYLTERSGMSVKVVHGTGDQCDAQLRLGPDALAVLSPSGTVIWSRSTSR